MMNITFFVAFRREAGIAVGRGPCADLFKGEKCPFSPDYPAPDTDAKAHPACCDSKGCFCECIYTCSSRQDIFTKLEKSLKLKDFIKCTTSIKSMNEGNDWKEEQCKKSKGSYDHRETIRQCNKRGVKDTCVRAGICMKNRKGTDECRFCFR